MCRHELTSLKMLSVCVALLTMGFLPSYSAAEGTMSDLSDDELSGVSAKGIDAGGDVSPSCSSTDNTICIGTFEWNDDHQFDASDHKGAIDMSGNVQQYVSANINVNATQSATSVSNNIIGDISSVSNTTISQENVNNTSGFVGGF